MLVKIKENQTEYLDYLSIFNWLFWWQ